MINEVLNSLCALPHRYSTSANEHRAAEYLRHKLDDLEIDAQLVPFVAPTTFSWIYLILYLGFLISVVTGIQHPVVALAIALFFAVLFYGEQTTRFSPLSQWVPEGLSHNVIGKIPGRNNPRNTLILCAHYDTSKTALIFHPGFVAGLRRAFFISLIMIGLIIVGNAARIAVTGQALRIINWAMAVPGVYMGVMCLGMIEREARGVPVNGAADNASGVATVMELAKRVKEKGGLSGWDVTVLLTGSEEVGLAGMSHFMRENGKRLDPAATAFINFDNMGGGKLTVVREEGMLKGLPADPELLRTAEGLIASDPRFADIDIRAFRALTLDSLVPNARGHRVLSLMGLNKAGVPTPWHWHNDTLEHLDKDMVRLAAEFGWELVNRLETGGNAEDGPREKPL
ncbi:MAG TPA: M28 family peptidase [bacterium]|nr:M28 family peptidase [bacterium]